MNTARRLAGVSRRRRSVVVLLMALGLIAGAGVASAADGDSEEPAADTLLNFTYDADNHIFLANTSATDSTYDCTLADRTLTAHYGAVNEDRIPVAMLLEEDKAVLFANRPEEEVGTDSILATQPVPYTGAEGDCGVSGGVVGGPNGQINHGQFMRLFHELFDKQGMGCLNRVIAQSDLGKGDQQLRTSDADPAFSPGSSGEVDFTTVATDCKRDKKDKADDDQTSTAHGKKDKSDKSRRSDSPGNSGNAPDHNK